MGFELSIAVKRDRLEGQDTGDPAALAPYATITLNGLLEPPASREVLRTVAALFGEGADSVLIEMDDVRADNQVYLQNFAAELMSLRGAGRHVQVVAREPSLHAEMAQMANSRDWLLAFTASKVNGARHAIHVDGCSKR